ncbi:uncharacterized protein DUF2017 [Ilumatobacter fluminis]|uniref:Uncharacterized protein DUF2017 n=1 Tax=Ilumatobacter fluminis TaxID=467091 RepID=A0A4R7HY16_9ACTN|nr:DUF2017 family protein [Ilumatobacter fluminis]TDT15023.1 uncharacterized protein DUF2017 [Ilumatobacter fluminis]
MSRFRGPVRSTRKGFEIAVDDDEAALIRRLAGELRQLLTDDADDEHARALLVRLFPTAYPDDEELEEEYQRLMREELVASKLAALDVVDRALAPGADPLDDAGLLAFMQSVNSVRLILGTMLEVSDDPDADEVRAGLEDSPEYALYSYLSWLLEHCVRALS